MLVGLVGEEGGGVAEVDAWEVGKGVVGGGVCIWGGGEGRSVEDLAHVDCGGGGGVGYYYAVEGAERGEGV